MYPVRLLTTPSDGNIRYYEYENDKFEYLSEHKSLDPQRGLAFMPRRGINVRLGSPTPSPACTANSPAPPRSTKTKS